MLAAIARNSEARNMRKLRLAALLAIGMANLDGGWNASGSTTSGSRYEDLLKVFTEWREFQKPRFVEHVPDFTAAAMAEQKRRLPEFQRRLASIDTSGWPIPQQVDWHLVRAEMNGLDFDHRVLRPWANDPAFYVTVFPDESDQPAREGPFAEGSVELWSYAFPLSAKDAETIGAGLRAVPALLSQARTNLVGNGKDLWTFGARDMRQQGPLGRNVW